ncbi:MAG: hypothetical protein Q8941_06235 [Bacteroidota bacterium]|nr:hypothetical protein [Bacteroidota bacterium]
MRNLLLIALLLVVSCQSLTEEEKLHKMLAGNWIILYPDQQLKDNQQEIIYGRIQDSIVGLTGLKLIILSENGVFRQIDSVEKKGKWGMSPDSIVFVENGGKEFDNFSARYTGYKDGTLQLTGFVEAEEEKIELVWKLKKITGSTASGLFGEKNNEWRRRPNQPESEKQMKTRLGNMLHYYSDYCYLVTREASFFIPARIILPVKFYQHAMGMAPFDEESFFAKLFFNKQQAREAHHYLSVVIRRLSDEFPAEDTYGKEYAAFMKKMADEIVKE